MTNIHDKTKLPPIKTPHGVLSKQFRYPALRGNRGFLSGRSQTSEWKASRDRQRSSNGALY
ncbi:hypothetical protein AWE92_24935 [Escherichia coli]|nr:hypothetical protein AWE92_24935 [Escherichia coli]